MRDEETIAREWRQVGSRIREYMVPMPNIHVDGVRVGGWTWDDLDDARRAELVGWLTIEHELLAEAAFTHGCEINTLLDSRPNAR